MKRWMICMVALAFLVSAAHLQAADTVKLGTFPIPLMVESSDKGVFIDLTKELAKRAGLNAQFDVAPPERTVDSFAKKSIAGFFPALDITVPGAAAKSAPIYVKTDFVFYRKGSPLKTVKDLEGKTVGITRGYPYAPELTQNKNIKFDVANDDVTNMKKLAAGRIDAFVVEEKSGLKALQASGETSIEYDPNQKLSGQNVFYAFQDTPEGKGYAENFSKALEAAKADGTFAKIMSQAK